MDIAALTPDAAAAIYRDEYWNPYAGRVAAVAPALAVLVFDAAVNQGPKAAVEMLQGIVGTLQDGKIGPMTLAALESAIDAHGEGDVMARYAAARALRYVNTRGWDRRLVQPPDDRAHARLGNAGRARHFVPRAARARVARHRSSGGRLMLTTQQLTTLASAIRADTDQAVIDALAIRNDVALAELYNAATTHVVWRSTLTPEQARAAISGGAGLAQLDNLTAGKRDSLGAAQRHRGSVRLAEHAQGRDPGRAEARGDQGRETVCHRHGVGCLAGDPRMGRDPESQRRERGAQHQPVR